MALSFDADPPAATSARLPVHRRTLEWFGAATFAPRWLPGRWGHPVACYAWATGLTVATAALSYLITVSVPNVSFHTPLSLLAVLGVALTWGAGPSVLATVLAGVLLSFHIYSPHPFWGFRGAGDGVDILVFVLAGLAIGLLASRAEASRRELALRRAEAEAGRRRLEQFSLALAIDAAAQVRARRRTAVLARQLREERDRLQQVVDAIPEAILIADATPAFRIANRAAREILGMEVVGRPVPVADEDASSIFGTRRLDGTPYPSAQLPLQRALLRNEDVRGDQFLIRNAATGRDVPVLTNAAPLRDAAGAVTGAVVVFQDIAAMRNLERAREEFLSSVAHDLKNPLTAVRGMTQLAQRRLAGPDDADPASVLHLLAGAQRGVDALVGLIDELQDVARQQMGARLDMRRRWTDLVALVRDCVEAQREASEHPIHLEATATELTAQVDPGRIERVVGNLLSNAHKYSPAQSAIWVRVAREAGVGGPQAVITVRDEGIGIPAGDLPHVFERFRRARNTAGHIEGTGIGLASARGIVEQHGGTITVETVEGAGSTFTVRLPLAPP